MTGGLVQHDNLPIVSQGMLWPIASVVRSSVASYYDQNMRVTEAPANAQRVTHRIKRYENVLLQNRSITTSPWTTNGTPVAAQNETGVDGAANKAWTITDDDAGQFEYYQQDITIPNDATTHCGVWYFKKTTGSSTFPGISFLMLNGTSVQKEYTIDTDNGVAIVRSIRTEADLVSVTDTGTGFWRIVIAQANNASGNTNLSIRVHASPAAGATGVWTAAPTGTVVYDFGGVFLNQKTAPPDHVLIETGATPKKQWQMFGNHLLDNRDLSSGNWILSGTQTIAQNETGVDGLPNKAWTFSDTDATNNALRYQDFPIADDSSPHTSVFYIGKTTAAATFPSVAVELRDGTTSVIAIYIVNTDAGSVTPYVGNAGASKATVASSGNFWKITITAINNSTGNVTIRPSVWPASNSDASGNLVGSTTGSCVYDYGHVFLYSHAAPDVLIESDSEVRYFNDVELHGQMVENTRTNLLLRSEEFDNAAWAKTNTTITADSKTAPDGTTTADKIVETTATGLHRVHQDLAGIASAGLDYSETYFVKPAERFWCEIGGQGTPFADSPSAYFNVIEGYIGTVSGATVEATIEAVGDGFYRVSLKTETVNSGTGALSLRLATGDTVNNYTGVATNGLFVWGGQLEQAASPTSYIKTVASQVTRLADAPEGAFNEQQAAAVSGVIEFDSDNLVGGTRILYVSDGTDDNRAIDLLLAASGGVNLRAFSNIGGVTQVDIINGKVELGQRHLVAFRLAENDFKVALDGRIVISDTSYTLPPGVDRYYIGTTVIPNNWINGAIRKLEEYSRALTDAELVEKSTL